MARVTRFLIIGSAALGLIGSGAGPARAQRATPVDCSAVHVTLPFGATESCAKWDLGHGSSTRYTSSLCDFTQFRLSGGDVRRGFVVFTKEGSNLACYIMPPNDQELALKRITAFVRRGGRDFSPVKQFDRTYAMSFTADVNGAPAGCFAFEKFGSVRGAGFSNSIFGHVCNRDRTPVTDAEIQQTVGAISIN